MRPVNYMPDASALLTTLASLTLFAAPALAQNNNGGNGNNDDNNNNDNASSEAPQATQTNEDNPPASSTQENDAERTSEPARASSTEENEERTSSQASETTERASITGGEAVTESSVEPPRITGGAQATSDLELTGFPSLTRQIGIPTYPPPAVPPVGDAPFMQQSTLPDGTVFIAVGAILGAFGVAILLWRFIVSCMLHRSVQRATMAQHDANNKASFPAPPAPFYKYTDQGSTMSLSAAAATGTGRAVRRSTRGPTPSSNPSQSNLFFSPTAAQNNPNGGNRASAFLPSGFYAAGSGSPAPNHGHSISLTNLRPDSRGHYANASRGTLNASPPGTPNFPAPRRDMSASSINLHTPPGQERAPSAYLEDLLADDPGSLPPPVMPGSGNSRHSAHLRTGSPGYRS
ncbi:hypothetical protein HJFPF1_11278 [Paramyrothecium foliicola]|nr:hypothetical protein HJFPF1_11278 [Paramyrothecium foliicola]